VSANPIIGTDPNGTITIITRVQLGFKCGLTARYRFDVSLDNTAPCDGYLVQRVVVFCWMQKDCFCDCSPKKFDWYVFYEAKKVKHGTFAGLL